MLSRFPFGQGATAPLRSAAMLWVTNIIVLASWDWRLDAGGPHASQNIL
jgi:hypothetical protein